MTVLLVPDGEEVHIKDDCLAVVAGVDDHTAAHDDNPRAGDLEVAFLIVEGLVDRAAADERLDVAGLVIDLAARVGIAQIVRENRVQPRGVGGLGGGEAFVVGRARGGDGIVGQQNLAGCGTGTPGQGVRLGGEASRPEGRSDP